MHNDTHICEQFLHFCVGLGSDFVLCTCLGMPLLCFCVSLDHFNIPLLHAFVVLGLAFFSTKPRDWL